MSDEESEDTGVRITDKRRIDPDTFEVRQPSEVGAPDEGGIVEGEFDEVEAKVAELTSDLQRVHAEYANYRKRVDRDRELIRETAIGSVFAALLPVLDAVDQAREHGELEGAFKSVGESLQSTCSKFGLEAFGAAEEPFDPTVHEALTSVSDEAVTEPTVTSVYQPGYRFAGRILRPARVAVAGTD